MNDLDLLEKTELRIEQIGLHNANLNAVAAVVAETIGIERSKVLVTDVRNDVLTLDVFPHRVKATNLVARESELLEGLSKVPGVCITDRTAVFSDGVLGWIALDEQVGKGALARAFMMADEIRHKLARRAIVFSTGAEVASGQIEDTNMPAIVRKLEGEEYAVTRGGTLTDDRTLIAGRLREAILVEGFSLVITTGGVGAEEKDCTVEAVLELDPHAVTPYIAKYRKGTGRHHKDGVRVAVGCVADALIVALPGPNDEVAASLEVLVHGLQDHLTADGLARAIAERLRAMLREKSQYREHGNSSLPVKQHG